MPWLACDFAVGKNVWNRCNIRALFPSSVDADFVQSMILEIISEGAEIEGDTLETHGLHCSIEEEDATKDWVTHVQRDWKPILCARDSMVLVFPWHGDEEVQEAVKGIVKGEDLQRLKLEGGVAFGTGEHATTRLCLDWLAAEVENKKNMKLLDYGSGSGILGIAACLLGDVQSVGVDIDLDAVRCSNANAQQNNVDFVGYFPAEWSGDPEIDSIIAKGLQRNNGLSKTLPGELNGRIYDACVANILAHPLTGLVETLAGMVKFGGRLGLSGIMTHHAEMVVEAYRPFFGDVVVEKEVDDWVLITGTRNVEMMDNAI